MENEKLKTLIGYNLYYHRNGNYIGHFLKLKDIIQYCLDNSLSPNNVIIFRIYEDEQNNKELQLMFIEEFAFKTQKTFKCGGIDFKTVEYVWIPENTKDITYSLKSDSDISKENILVYSPKFSKIDYLKLQLKIIYKNSLVKYNILKLRISSIINWFKFLQ